MSLLHETAPDDRQLERYLLGLLPDGQAERLDQASIEDDGVASRLRIVEDDLIDGYVRGTLEPETLRRFESYYLSSNRRRERVAFAARFLAAVDRAAADVGAISEVNGSPGVESRSLHSRLRLMLTSAAAVLIAVSGVWFVSVVRSGSDRRAAQESATVPDRQASGSTLPAAAPGSIGGAADKRSPAPREARPSTPSAPVTRPAQEALTIALVLAPQTRAGGPIQALSLPPTAERVGMELRLEPGDASVYEVGLKDPATNRVVWRSGWIAKTSSGDETSIVVAVPARVLKTQHYSFDLYVRDAGGRTDVAGSYTFKVVPH
jgi:hypothetical protein